MRLLVLVEFFPPKLGSDRRIYEIMSRLSRKHEIHFVAIPPFRALSGDFQIKDKDLNHHVDGETTAKTFGGIFGHFIPIPRFLVKIWRRSYGIAYLLTFVAVLPRTIMEIRKINPEAIVLNYPSPYTGIMGFVAGKVLGKPVILDFNDLIAQYSALLLNLKTFSSKARMLVLVQDFLVRNTSKVVATTNLIRKYAIDLGIRPQNVFIVPNGADTEVFCPQDIDPRDIKSQYGLDGKKVCLYSGRLDGWAGIDILMGLCKELEDNDPDVRLVIVGGKLADREHPSNLVVIDETPYEQMPMILNMADTILVPFPENIVSHATSPLKLFEGMAVQKPVIASKVRGIEEVITHEKNGILVEDPSSVRKWRQAVERVLNSRALAKKMAQEARHTAVSKYDWGHLAEEYEKVFMVRSSKLFS